MTTSDGLGSKAEQVSPFSVEYVVQELIYQVYAHDMKTSTGLVHRTIEILRTDDFDIAHGALAGLKMQCGLRDRSGEPSLKNGRTFAMLARVVTPYATAEGTTAFLEAANEGLKLYDLAHGWPKEGT